MQLLLNGRIGAIGGSLMAERVAASFHSVLRLRPAPGGRGAGTAPARGFVIHTRRSADAVSQVLGRLYHLGVQVRSSTLTPGPGPSGALQVEVRRALSSREASEVAASLLGLEHVERVEPLYAAVAVSGLSRRRAARRP